MLTQLSITNYILIKQLQIEFQLGFSVITGETGAGKSIILGALGLILGERADREVVLENEKKCVIEGQFDISALQLQPFFEQFDLDYENICILRREITAAGKSRAFVNDTPVHLPLLRELGVQLMDVHSQNQNQQLNNALFRLNLVDAYSKHDAVLNAYKSNFLTYQQNIKKLDQLKTDYQLQLNEQEYHQFLLDEIEQLQIQKGEQKELEDELQILNNAEEIKSALYYASYELSGSESNIADRIQTVLDKLKSISSFQTEVENLAQRLESAHIEIKDIAEDVVQLEDHLVFDPSRLEYINDRLESLLNLTRKHHLNDADDLLKKHDTLSEKIHSVLNLDEEIEGLEKEIHAQFKDLNIQAETISAKRKKAAHQIASLVVKNLRELGMEKADFHIDLEKLKELGISGRDKINFLFRANSGSKMAAISKVASGGELSRIMLSLKYALALKKALPAIVFDEIDSGVSGEIADKLADLMRSLGEKMQVISISHLPQIASKAKHHYLVYKENASTFTRSTIKKLDNKERIIEIAAMLSGSNIGNSAIDHAKELLSSSNK